jgi:hypothetical protein
MITAPTRSSGISGFGVPSSEPATFVVGCDGSVGGSSTCGSSDGTSGGAVVEGGLTIGATWCVLSLLSESLLLL